MEALHQLFPDYVEEIENSIGTLKYPRPISEPPSPSSSRMTTPAASVHGSDDEGDSVDSEAEVNYAREHNPYKIMFSYQPFLQRCQVYQFFGKTTTCFYKIPLCMGKREIFRKYASISFVAQVNETALVKNLQKFNVRTWQRCFPVTLDQTPLCCSWKSCATATSSPHRLRNPPV